MGLEFHLELGLYEAYGGLAWGMVPPDVIDSGGELLGIHASLPL